MRYTGERPYTRQNKQTNLLKTKIKSPVQRFLI